jgi:sugar phosphate isomerase/epimerase
VAADLFQVGFNARLFPNNWRPARDEVDFGSAHGFAAIQFPGEDAGLGAERLADPPEIVGAALTAAGMVAVMEIVVRLLATGRTASGFSPLQVLKHNLPAIAGLRCERAHLHLVYVEHMAPAALVEADARVAEDLAAGVEVGRRYGFRFGVEHNEPDFLPLGRVGQSVALLEQVPDLGFVFDINHALPEDAPAFFALASRMTMLHISDTPLPEVNHHLPLGLGRIPMADYCRALAEHGFAGPAILEIGGLPKSGGYGRDTDAALLDSAARLRDAIAAR